MWWRSVVVGVRGERESGEGEGGGGVRGQRERSWGGGGEEGVRVESGGPLH
jgi:hypothetical protein